MAVVSVVSSYAHDLLFMWVVVIVIVGVIGALIQTPPETTYQVVSYDSSKVQYISIGGESKTNISSQ
jgi:flagellar biosynthesis protein FlhB